jgi:hypothetical protein
MIQTYFKAFCPSDQVLIKWLKILRNCKNEKNNIHIISYNHSVLF